MGLITQSECIESTSEVSASLFSSTHPETSERFNGIIMANKSMRALNHCNDEQAPYRFDACELPHLLAPASEGGLP